MSGVYTAINHSLCKPSRGVWRLKIKAAYH